MTKNNFLLLLMIFSFSLYAQKKDKASIERIAKAKVNFITSQLNLNAEESEKFWTVYNNGKKELQGIIQQKRKINKNKDLNTITDAEAQKIVEELHNIETASLKRKQQLDQDLAKILSYKQLLKLKTSENKFKRKLLEIIKATK